MPKDLHELISSLDVFGQTINLTIDRQEKSQTVLGGILAINIVLALGILFILNILDVLNHKNPIVTNEVIRMSKSQAVILDKNSFPFAIVLTKNTNEAQNLTQYFTLGAKVLTGETAKQLKEINLPLTECPDDVLVFFGFQPGTHGVMCIENQNVTIDGGWEGSWIQYLEISLLLCKNNSMSNKCGSMEELNKLLKNETYYFNFMWKDSGINPEDYEQPITEFAQVRFKSLVTSIAKYSLMYIRNQMIVSDDGLLYSTSNTNSSISYYEEVNDYSYEEGLVIRYEIYASNSELKVNRFYVKIQSTFANIGGLINAFKIACTLICYMFSSIKRDEAILNKIFDFDITHNNPSKRRTFIDRKKTLENIIQNRKINNRASLSSMYVTPSNLPSRFEQDQNLGMKNKNNSPYTNKEHLENVQTSPKKCSPRPRSFRGQIHTQQSYMKEISPRDIISFSNLDASNATFHKMSPVKAKHSDETLDIEEIDLARKIHDLLEQKSTQYKLHFTFCQIIRAFICPFKCCFNAKLKEKKNLYQKSKYAIGEFTDLTYLIQKMEDLDKLKFIVLNNDQLCMFNFISNNLCSLSPEKEQIHRIHQFKKITRDKIRLIAQLILKTKNRSASFSQNISNDMDSRIFDLLNEELKNLI